MMATVMVFLATTIKEERVDKLEATSCPSGLDVLTLRIAPFFELLVSNNQSWGRWDVEWGFGTDFLKKWFNPLIYAGSHLPYPGSSWSINAFLSAFPAWDRL